MIQADLPRPELMRFIQRYAFVPAEAGRAALAYAPFVTSIFLHGGLFHLISNMWALWLFADNVEDRLGSARFLFLYLLTGVAANLAHYFANPASSVPTIGASGAIAGVMGAYFLLYPRARIITLLPVLFYPLIVEIPAAFYLLVWFATQLINAGAVSAASAVAGGVAWWAHIGGFAAGLAAVIFLKPARRRRSYEDEYYPW